EAGDDRVELVARLVDEPVLAEDPALRQVLVDEFLVVLAERTRELDRHSAAGPRGGGRGRRRGRGKAEGGNVVGRGQLEVLFDRRARGGRPGRRGGGGAAARLPPPERGLGPVRVGV